MLWPRPHSSCTINEPPPCLPLVPSPEVNVAPRSFNTTIVDTEKCSFVVIHAQYDRMQESVVPTIWVGTSPGVAVLSGRLPGGD